MSRLFVSYRRADRPDTVKILCERLRARLPRWHVFYDHESIAPGEDFPKRIADEVAAATVVLVVVGPRWVEELRRRQPQAIDHVREEVRRALASGCTVVPVLVDHAPPPGEADVAGFPELAALPSLNARRLRPDPDFNADLEQIVAFLEPLGPSVDVGTVLAGKYKLTQAIGEGGMGVVYRAEQREPKRTVAVKLIKPGMDSKEVLARFETERQALAVMDHPNIARVIDAGTTPAGRPFFVMDFVRGAAITDYCDDRKVPLADRLALFCQVCDAVQHAHQKGIIHRDLKPTNVLVEVVGDRPVPKVIDFGLAKAMSRRLTDRSFVSEIGKTVGTLPYSSPEQAAGKTFEVDTRTDIYSLGALLYEILAGTPPFSHEELRAAGEEAMRAMIRDREPLPPSSKLGSSPALPSIAAKRLSEPARLTRQVVGELDWIVMKALDKEPARRYATAASFADDVQHYLRDEPVTAGKPSRLRRLRKFARRHRGAVLGVAAVFLVLALGVVGTSIGFLKAREETDKAVDAAGKEKEAKELAERRFAQLDQANTVIAGLAVVQDPFLPAYAQLPADVAMVRKLQAVVPKIDEIAGGDALIRAKLQLAVGTAHVSVGESGKAIELLNPARAAFRAEHGDDHESTMDADFQAAIAYMQLNKCPEALAILGPLKPRFESRFGETGEMNENLLYVLAMTLVADGKPAEGARHIEEVVARRARAKNPNDVRLVAYRFVLVSLYERTGERDKREALVREVMASRTEALGSLDPKGMMAQGINKLADALKADDGKAAVQGLQTMYEESRKRVGIYHPNTCTLAIVLMQLHCMFGTPQPAISLGEEVGRTLKERYGEKHFLTLVCQTYLALAYVRDKKLPQAAALIEPAHAALLEQFSADSPLLIDSYTVFGACQSAKGNLRAGIANLRKAAELSAKVFGEGSPQALAGLDDVADLLQHDKQGSEAVAVGEKVLAAARAKHGPDSNVTIAYQLRLAERLQKNGKSGRAAELGEDAVRTLVRSQGANHAMVALALEDVDRLLDRIRFEPDGAGIPILRKSVAARIETLGEGHPGAESLRRKLGEALLFRPDTEEEGERMLTRLIDARRARHPKGHVETGKMLEELAYHYMQGAMGTSLPLPERQRRAIRAVACFADALEQPAPLTRFGRDRANILMSMGRLETIAGRPAEAVKRYEASRADLLAQDKERREGLMLVQVDEHLRELYRRAKNFDKALEVAKEANEVGKTLPNPSPAELAERHAFLVLGHLEARQVDEAVKVADALTPEQLARIPVTEFRRPRIHWYLAVAHVAKGNDVKARALLAAAAEQLEKAQFANRDSVSILRELIDCLSRLDRHAEAEAWQRKVVAHVRRRDGTQSTAHGQELATLGLMLTEARKWADAEPVLAESLALREKLVADPKSGVAAWQVANVRSLLGESLFRQDKPCEKFLMEGCEALFQHADSIPDDARMYRVFQGSERMVRLHLAGKRPADASRAADRYAAWVEKLKVDKDPGRYNAARLFALCVEKEKPDAEMLKKCLALLGQCRDAGYFNEAANVKEFDDEDDLRHLRGHPDLVAFAKTLKR